MMQASQVQKGRGWGRRLEAHQQADSTLVVRAGLCNVLVLARVAPPGVLVWVRIAALLPGVRVLHGAWLDLHRGHFLIQLCQQC